MEFIEDFAKRLNEEYGDYGPIDIFVPEKVFYRIRTDISPNFPSAVTMSDRIDFDSARVRIKPKNEENLFSLKMFNVPGSLEFYASDYSPDGHVYTNTNTKLFLCDLIHKGIKS